MRLLESNATRRRSRGGTVVSVLLHTAIIFGAVVATARARPVAHDPPPEDIVWTAPPPEPAPAPTRGPSSGHASSNASTATPPPIIPTVSVDVDVLPDDVPVVADPTRGLADSFTRGIAASECADCAAGATTSGEVRDLFHVERAAAPLNVVRPRYPETLRAAGIPGRAVAQFVVDTLGRVEPGTVRLTSATHPAFGESALAAIRELRFRPAEAGGRRVRQLVALPFEFVLR